MTNKSIGLIQKIRKATGAGVMDIKRALEEAGEDEVKILEILKEKGFDKAAKRIGRELKAGLIASYIHSNGRIGALVEVGCETDFVAKNEEFRTFVSDLAMQIAATNPKVVSREEAEESGKVADEEILLLQPFIKDQDKTIGELLTEKIAKIGENIQIKRFARFEVGE
mgnify:CR=1 FL=1